MIQKILNPTKFVKTLQSLAFLLRGKLEENNLHRAMQQFYISVGIKM